MRILAAIFCFWSWAAVAASPYVIEIEPLSTEEHGAHSHSHSHDHAMARTSAGCSEMEVWDYAMGMCQPFPMGGMPMRMLMFHGNAFANYTAASGPRGRDGFTIPNMFMIGGGSSVGDAQYFSLDFMGTVEKWTYPRAGYPELLQIGEENGDHQPYVDAQHPHSSPIMGLTLSDTISLGHEKDHVKVFVAPRGQSTDGPVAFMHRPSGMANPDAPLGHHLGQDAGHIASTVIGSSLRLGGTNVEASTFNGEEPEPDHVDLPIGTPNSYALRLTQEIHPGFFVMASGAYVKEPEAHGMYRPDHLWRYSASIYRNQLDIGRGWIVDDALIWGMIRNYDGASVLHSFGKEFAGVRGSATIWGRVEVLQRTPGQLLVSGVANLTRPRWVGAFTLGYTHKIARLDFSTVGLGGAFTQNLLPSVYRPTYGGNPYSVKVFLQLSGMKGWDLL